MTYSQFEFELQAFDRESAPHDAAVFYGSSSIRLWDNLVDSFPGIPVVNRGFGGSTLAECIDLLPRLIYPLRPASIVLYASDNDLDQGATPGHVEHLFHQFIIRLRQNCPAIPIALISVKPSPARFWNLANIRRANTLLQGVCPQYPDVTFLDLFPRMLSPSGGSRPDLFTDDGLHMNHSGYALWTETIRPWLDSITARRATPLEPTL